MSFNNSGYYSRPPLIPGSANLETEYVRFFQAGSITDGVATLTNGTLSNLNDPVNLKDAANKEYVLANATTDPSSNRTWKNPVLVASTGNVTLSGLQTIDGVQLSVDDRVLLKNQTDAQEMGVYIANAGTWTRSTDCAEGVQATGVFIYVMAGTTNSEKVFYCETVTNAAPFYYPVNFGNVTGIMFSELVANNSASGPNNSVQYNIGGSLTGSAGFTFDGTDKINIQQIQSTNDLSAAYLYSDHSSSLLIGSSTSTLFQTAIYGYGPLGINLIGSNALVANDPGGSINITGGLGNGVGAGGSIVMTTKPSGSIMMTTTAGGSVKILSTANSTSVGTGALIVSGGASIGSSVNIGSTVSASAVKAGNTIMTSGQIVGLNTPSSTDLDFAANVNYVNSQVGSSAAGSNTQVQFNNSGAFGASSSFTFNGTNLGVLFSITTANLQATVGTILSLQATSGTITGLQSTNIRTTSITSTNLTSTNITSTNLMATNLIGTNITSTNLISSNLVGASITSTNLMSTNISAGNLSATTISSINYVGLSWKNSVRLASSLTNITESGVQSIDSLNTATGDRILLIAQTEASSNGIYIANDGGAWTKPVDMAVGSDAAATIMYVSEGTVNGGNTFRCVNAIGQGIVGTDNLSFTLFNTGSGGGGGGGTPAGPSGSVQYNNGGTFLGTSNLTVSGNITFATNLTSTNLMSTTSTISSLTVNTGSFFGLVATNLTSTNLVASDSTISNIVASTGSFFGISVTNITSTNLMATSGTISNIVGSTGSFVWLNTTNLTSSNLASTIGTVSNLVSTNISTGNLNISGQIFTSGLTTSNLVVTSGTITNLTSTDITSVNLVATSSTLSSLTSTNITSVNLMATSGTVSNLASTLVSAVTITATSLNVSGSSIVQGISATMLNATTITAGTLSVSGSSVFQGISATILSVTTITSGTLNVSGQTNLQNVTSTNLVSTNISAGNLNATTISSVNYVGLSWKNSVRLSSSLTNITASGVQNIDGTNTATGDRILLIAQTLPVQNGIYIADDGGAWSRSIDMDTGSDAAATIVYVAEGVTAGNIFRCTNSIGSGIVGTNDLTFTVFSSGGGGGGGTPGAPVGSIQYNAGGSFGGSSNLTFNSGITFATNLTATNLMATSGTITSLASTNISTSNLIANIGTITNLLTSVGTVANLLTTSISTVNLYATGGTISNLLINGNTISIDTSTGSLVVSGGVGISGDVYAYDYNTVSDARYKSDISQLNGSLDTISKINGYSYIFDPTGKRNYGFLAQQLEEAGLDVPVNGSGTSMMSVNYQSIIPLLVEAIKELNNLIKKD